MPQNISEILWIYILYSIIGWMVEVSYAGLEKGKFINRGFLNGPYCPIYGCGMLIVISLLYPIRDNWIILFFGSFLLTTILEYLTGFILEKFFQNKWWDYSNYPFNINGYICLKFSIFWGLGCTFIVKIVHPMIYWFISIIPNLLDQIFLSIIILLILIDFIETILDILNFNKKIKSLDDLAKKMRLLSNEIGEEVFEKTSIVIEKTNQLQDEYEEKRKQLEQLKKEFDIKINDKHRSSERLIKAFPDVSSKKLGETLEKYKELLKNKKE